MVALVVDRGNATYFSLYNVIVELAYLLLRDQTILLMFLSRLTGDS